MRFASVEGKRMRERGVFYVYGRGKSGFVRELRVASVLIFEGFDRAGFEGEVASGLAQALTEDRLRNLKSEVIGEEDGLLAKGRHRVVVLTFEMG